MGWLPVLILAAGASSRMGGADKLLLEEDSHTVHVAGVLPTTIAALKGSEASPTMIRGSRGEAERQGASSSINIIMIDT